MQDIQTFIKQPENSKLFQQTTIGIEREGHRVTPDGKLALTPHPPKIDGSTSSFFIQRDFAESQLELVTPPVQTSKEVMQWLQAIHEVAIRSAENEERIWPFSTPPQLPADDDISVAQLQDPNAIKYREYLISAYGKRLQMISGIHYNLGMNDEFLHKWYEYAQSEKDFKQFKSNFFLRLARNFLRYQWILVYLFGATPAAHETFYNQPDDKFDHPIRSIRNSHLGYINKSDVTYSYTSLEDYAKKLAANVKEGRLIAEKEFYSNVRLRGGKNSKELLKNGIQYLEFRLFDIQPDATYGITAQDIEFFRYFILYLVWMDTDSDMDDVYLGNQMKTQVAEENPFEPSQYQSEGQQVLTDMESMLDAIHAPQVVFDALHVMQQRMQDSTLTPAARFYNQAKTDSQFVDLGTERAAENYAKAMEIPYALGGFTDMELSTQLLLFDAIQQGYEIDILDRDDQMIRVRYGNHDEIIKNSNITSRDSYSAFHVMTNKEVTKKLLAEAGYTVPRSTIFNQEATAKEQLEAFTHRPIVVKPKSTNMGIGITIFKEGADSEALRHAIELAFSKDDVILIEDYVFGTEYRFFVLDGVTKAVLKRDGAHVVGDGKQTIRDLVADKNKDKLRGEDHRSPLEKIALGKEEETTLEMQGYTFDSIVEAGKKVYLRDNSNISTGGDSIDVTASMHSSYKQIAEGMANTLEVAITGLDLIIDDMTEPATLTNYAAIEANFNPMMMMHIYPAQGESVRLTKELLDFLFPEKTVF